MFLLHDAGWNIDATLHPLHEIVNLYFFGRELFTGNRSSSLQLEPEHGATAAPTSASRPSHGPDPPAAARRRLLCGAAAVVVRCGLRGRLLRPWPDRRPTSHRGRRSEEGAGGLCARSAVVVTTFLLCMVYPLLLLTLTQTDVLCPLSLSAPRRPCRPFSFRASCSFCFSPIPPRRVLRRGWGGGVDLMAIFPSGIGVQLRECARWEHAPREGPATADGCG